MIGRGTNSVTAQLGEFRLISCYISPNVEQGDFLEFLDELGDEVQRLSSTRTIICGDFNSKSKLWDSPRTDRRGELVEEWAAEVDVRLMNVGNEPTCIRAQGQSQIDLTWCTPDMMDKINDWKVLQVETLSDHVYISMNVGNDSKDPMGGRPTKLGWNWRKADLDMFKAALIWMSATRNLEEADANQIAELTDMALRYACDIATSRKKAPKDKKMCHWWTDTIASLRRIATKKSRTWKRARRSRNVGTETLDRLQEEYRVAKQKLRKEVSKAKSMEGADRRN